MCKVEWITFRVHDKITARTDDRLSRKSGLRLARLVDRGTVAAHVESKMAAKEWFKKTL